MTCCLSSLDYITDVETIERIPIELVSIIDTEPLLGVFVQKRRHAQKMRQVRLSTFRVEFFADPKLREVTTNAIVKPVPLEPLAPVFHRVLGATERQHPRDGNFNAGRNQVVRQFVVIELETT